MTLIQRSRTTLFTVWLGLLTVITAIATFYTFAECYSVSTFHPEVPLWIPIARGILGLCNFVALIAIWSWKKYAVFSLIVSTAALFVLNVCVSVPLPASLSGLGGVFVLLLLIRPYWRHFDTVKTEMPSPNANQTSHNKPIARSLGDSSESK